MLVELEEYQGVKSWIRSRQSACMKWKCAYIEIPDDCPEELCSRLENDFDHQKLIVPGGVTYCRHGLNPDTNANLIEENHWIVGWDYAHSIDVVVGKKDPPADEEILADIHSAIDQILDKCKGNA